MQIDARGLLDVAFQLTGDGDLVGPYASRQLGAAVDGKVALDVDVALELAGAAAGTAVYWGFEGVSTRTGSFGSGTGMGLGRGAVLSFHMDMAQGRSRVRGLQASAKCVIMQSS